VLGLKQESHPAHLFLNIGFQQVHLGLDLFAHMNLQNFHCRGEACRLCAGYGIIHQSGGRQNPDRRLYHHGSGVCPQRGRSFQGWGDIRPELRHL